jgi:predicted transcriptional regulator
MRFLADIPDDDVKWLDQLAREQGKSRAAVLREAVSAYRPQAPDKGLEQGFGVWARHGVTVDPHDYDRARRAEWTRPWDDDYDEVRAASPEYFTSEDDKERAHYLALAKKAAEKRQKFGP